MKKFSVWLAIFAFLISLKLSTNGEMGVLLLFINPLMWIPVYFIDATNTSAKIYRLINDNFPLFVVPITTAFYFVIGLLLDYKLKSKGSKLIMSFVFILYISWVFYLLRN